MSRTRYIIGIDEVGRGPLAGPLCVGACAVSGRLYRRVRGLLSGVKDCKKLSPRAREEWFARIRSLAEDGELSYATAFVGEQSIDRRGISWAIRRAIRRTLGKLGIAPRRARVILDGGLRAPAEYSVQETIIGGDEREPLIATASIVAKVRRDRRMTRLARRYPAYGFEIHKGYGTAMHFSAIRRFGLCDIHRRSFVKEFSTLAK